MFGRIRVVDVQATELLIVLRPSEKPNEVNEVTLASLERVPLIFVITDSEDRSAGENEFAGDH
jgi:hypothetical protein